MILAFGFRVGIVAKVKAVEVCVRAAEETNVGAVVASESFAVKLPTEITSGHRVDRGITQPISGAIDILPLSLIEEKVSRSGAQQPES